jgi:predicted small lipoprotein YifL
MLNRLAVLAILLAGTLTGCGRPGFPVPPDDYGIGVRMQKERQKEEQARKDQEAREAAAAKQKADEGIVTPPDEIILPDMRPVGGR